MNAITQFFIADAKLSYALTDRIEAGVDNVFDDNGYGQPLRSWLDPRSVASSQTLTGSDSS